MNNPSPRLIIFHNILIQESSSREAMTECHRWPSLLTPLASQSKLYTESTIVFPSLSINLSTEQLAFCQYARKRRKTLDDHLELKIKSGIPCRSYSRKWNTMTFYRDPNPEY
ncbi:hypothetical protein INT43_001738 [Umbelopsis isabellina]|uniref:Uncharacterized protein n=1 Tax=Mortierella isabellina TaxID=91625 RepID=A0A8H7PRE4_MORIS|nr:hypothetical protein INT43_001738 [Umbelopsis isabellina]